MYRIRRDVRKFLLFLLLFVMQLQVLHAFVIDVLDKHPCDIVEYVTEIQAPLHVEDVRGDICEIHHIFHTPFVVPVAFTFVGADRVYEHNFHTQVFYTDSPKKRFLKPPIL